MSKSTKRHWPPPESPDFVPEGWLPLFEAFKLVGRAQFGDAWMDGQELAAPSDEDLEAAREARARAASRQEEKVRHLAKAKRASVGVGAGVHTSRRPQRARAGQSPARAPNQGPPWPLFNDEARTEARARGDWVWNQLRQWLHADDVSQMVLDNHGVQHTPPRNVWASTASASILHTGRLEVGDQRGFAFVSSSQLRAAIHGELGSDESNFQGELQEKGVVSQAPEAAEAPDLTNEYRSKGGSRPKYDPGLQQFFDRLANEFKQKGELLTPATLRAWLLEYATPDDGHQPDPAIPECDEIEFYDDFLWWINREGARVNRAFRTCERYISRANAALNRTS